MSVGGSVATMSPSSRAAFRRRGRRRYNNEPRLQGCFCLAAGLDGPGQLVRMHRAR